VHDKCERVTPAKRTPPHHSLPAERSKKETSEALCTQITAEHFPGALHGKVCFTLNLHRMDLRIKAPENKEGETDNTCKSLSHRRLRLVGNIMDDMFEEAHKQNNKASSNARPDSIEQYNLL
jgi:hypothetical protein